MLLNRVLLHPAADVPQAIIGCFVIFYVSGANLTYLFQASTRARLDPWVHTLISFLNGIIVLPAVALLGYLLTKRLDTSTLFVSYVIPAAIPFVVNFTGRRADMSLAATLERALRHPVFWSAVLLLLIHGINISLYSFLPTPDTYSWVINYESNLAENHIDTTTIEDHRWAFAALSGALYHLANIEVYTQFKYAIPALSLIIPIPLWIIARRIKNVSYQYSLMAFAFITPTVIIEMEYARQQVIFLIFLYAAIALHVYMVQIAVKKPFFYLLGAFSLAGSFTHPAFLIYTTAWFMSALAVHSDYIKKHKIPSLLAVIFFIPWFTQTSFGNMALRMHEQAGGALRNMISGNWNLWFPTYFVNSDGYEMSWAGSTGVIKYYSFYVGPLSIVILCMTLLFLTSAPTRKQLLRMLGQPTMLPITLLILLFIAIAEIAPRFGNIAYLPDRAWQYLAILLILPAATILASLPIRPSGRGVLMVTLLLAGTNIAGASYINYLNGFTMPWYEQRAAAWMKENLEPHGARVFSSSSKNLLRYHGKMIYMGFDNNYYAHEDPREIIKHIVNLLDLPIPVTDKMDNIITNIATIQEDSRILKNKLADSRANTVGLGADAQQAINAYTQSLEKTQQELEQDIQALGNIQYQTVLFPPGSRQLYIYYAKTDSRNPYAGRPYASSFTQNLSVQSFPALDNTPRFFEPVYVDGKEVRIWRLRIENITEDMLL